MLRLALMVSFLAIGSHAIAADPPKIDLKDGDRIVYLGNTFAEQDQSYGYLETLLTIRNPNINFTFRNLGWSGDTVWGDARARFGTRADGFKHLKEHVLALKPTVILVAYGTNESFAGEAGLKEFEAGLNTLLDTLAATKARIALISPLPQENLGPPLPDPSAHNRDLVRYSDVMKAIASTRKLPYLDLGKVIATSDASSKEHGDAKPSRFTDDGLHPTERGYARLAIRYLSNLFAGTTFIFRELVLKADGSLNRTEGWNVSRVESSASSMTFQATGSTLPMPAFPGPDEHTAKGRAGGYFLILGIPQKDGQYDLKIDGQKVLRIDGKDVPVIGSFAVGPEVDQVDKLRALINKKNELYFHRWRPQNETYLFGFRKHEQGNNAIEIPQFDPLVAELEAQINALKKPVKHTYEIVREKDAN